MKLIAIDLDKTLVASGTNKISGYSKEVIRKLVNRCYTFVVVTGRNYSGIIELAKKLPEVRYWIYSCGAGIYDNITKKTSTLGTFKELFEDFRDLSLDIPNTSMFHKDNLRFSLIEIDNLTLGYINNELCDLKTQHFINSLIKNSNILKIRDYDKFIFYLQNYNKMNVYVGSKINNTEFNVDRVVYGSNTMNLVANGINKFTTLMKLAESLGYENEDILFFGDSKNDIDCFNGLKNTYLMKDSKLDLPIKRTKKPHYEDGLAYELEKLFLC